jgi:hypothetical protein
LRAEQGYLCLSDMNSTVYKLDPLQDPRWTALVETHPHASIFHTSGWMEALRRTYDYSPVAYTTSSPTGTLRNALVFARVRSWITGRRIVSLPFSDHCEPLFESREELNFVLEYLQSEMDHREWKYLEVRPRNGSLAASAKRFGFYSVASYYLHRVDLCPSLQSVFRLLDKNSVQRRVCHAERVGVIEKCGRSKTMLDEFYNLVVLTRRRHHLPPQPYVWFQNVLDCLGDAAIIRTAYTKDGAPIASILTLRFRNSVVYKYGGSDARFKSLGATPLLLWRAIEDAKANGATEFDLGRSDEQDQKLVNFKNHWDKDPSRLRYWRYPGLQLSNNGDWQLRFAKLLLAGMPDSVLAAMGRLLYRHIG